MILKTLRIKKKASFGRLVKYVMTHENKLREGFLITHNVMADDIRGITEEFHQNDDYRTNKRKNSVLLYHEIMSFAPEDSKNLTPEILQDIAQKYIDIRGSKALVVAKPHFEKSHWHLHFLLSGSEYRSNTLLRMDNKRFEHIRRSIEAYQTKHYPELRHSIVYTNKPERQRLNQKAVDQNVRKEKAFQAKQSGRILDKERISIAVQEMYHMSKDAHSFLSLLDAQDEVEVYYYREKPAGVKYGPNKGRKYRFITLGITKEMLQTLEQGKTQQKTEPRLWQMVLSDTQLQHYLQSKRQERQEIMLTKYQLERQTLVDLDIEKRPKALKKLLTNVLTASKTMRQFQYFLRQLDIKEVLNDDKLSGVALYDQVYTFKTLGMMDDLRAKQKAFERYQKWKQRSDHSKEASQKVEIELQIGGSGMFFL